MTNCKNCGAPLPSYPCKCEYCGTVYEKINEWDEVIARATSAGIITVNDARSLLGLDQTRYLDRTVSVGLRTEFINQILSKY